MDIYDVIQLYKKKNSHCTDEQINQIERLVTKGCPLAEIYRAVAQGGKNYTEFLKKSNLIEKDKFYFHPELQLTSKRPVYIEDEDGNLVPQEEITFTLKLKPYYSLYNVLEYFKSKFPYYHIAENRDVKALEYIYNNAISNAQTLTRIEGANRLDLLLFLIDSVSYLQCDGDSNIRSILELPEYKTLGSIAIDDAINMYITKYEACKEVGLDHVW